MTDSAPPHRRSSDSAREAVLERARAIGFDLVGLAPLGPPPDAERFARWLDQGRHGSMGYLERARGVTLDPRTQWPDGKTLLVVALGHSRGGVELAGGGRIARYAAGRDYHNVMGKMLKRLRRALIEDGLAAPGSAFVDATPLLERSHAEAAGLGTASKAANLLEPRFGPWFFLGEVLLDVDLEPTEPGPRVASCGSCTACIDACPTDAIVGPGEVDATRCISYATIEHRGLVPHELRERTEGWAFGCDICSEVCPWGSRAPDLSARFGTRPEFSEEAPDGAVLVEILLAGGAPGVDAEVLDTCHADHWRGSPLRRPRREGLARNAAVALGTRPTERGKDGLMAALEQDPSAVVRAAAAWALAHGHIEDDGVHGALDRALDRALESEIDTQARLDMQTSLERAH